MRRSPLVVATRNRGKLRELRPLFAAAGIEVVDLHDVGLDDERSDECGIEVHETFEANALAKARYFHAAVGNLACVADDSGLEVAALARQPGVRSRRWAATPGLDGSALVAANNARLIRELAGRVDRRATFVCAAAYKDAGHEVVRTGVLHGSIVDQARGSNGFGYDPHFLVAELGRTLAEATLEEKGEVSHRAAAFRALIAALGQAD